jgi:hypothetical protein
MSDIETLISRATALSDKADFWNSLVIWSLVVAAVAAVAIVFCQRMAFVRARQLVGVQARIAQIKEDAIKDQADKLQARLAEQQARTAEASAEAAAAKERTAEIMKATAWRQLTPEQYQKLVAVLTATPGKAVLAWIANDPESQAFAAQISHALEAAHWKYTVSARTYPVNLLWGVWVPHSDDASQSVTALRRAFDAINIKPITDTPPNAMMQYGGDAEPNSAELLIGSKRPTVIQPPN